MTPTVKRLAVPTVCLVAAAWLARLGGAPEGGWPVAVAAFCVLVATLAAAGAPRPSGYRRLVLAAATLALVLIVIRLAQALWPFAPAALSSALDTVLALDVVALGICFYLGLWPQQSAS